jgi:hypothetical protein
MQSEDTPTPKPEAEVDETLRSEELRSQASRLRAAVQSSGIVSLQERAWKKALCWMLLVLMASLALFLIATADTRLVLAGFLAQGWQRVWSGQPQQEMIRLPAPSRRPPPPTLVRVRSAASALTSSSVQMDTDPSSQIPPQEEQPASSPVAKSAGSESAYHLLREKSEVVRQLIAGEFADYDFKGWKPVKDNSPEFWIDFLVAQKSDGSRLHMIWRIDLDEGSVRALSQAARDLERKR